MESFVLPVCVLLVLLSLIKETLLGWHGSFVEEKLEKGMAGNSIVVILDHLEGTPSFVVYDKLFFDFFLIDKVVFRFWSFIYNRSSRLVGFLLKGV